MLAYVTGSVDQEVLLRNEYLAQENRILRSQLKGRVKLSDPDRSTLAEIGQRLGRKALQEVANIVGPWIEGLLRTRGKPFILPEGRMRRALDLCDPAPRQDPTRDRPFFRPPRDGGAGRSKPGVPEPNRLSRC